MLSPVILGFCDSTSKSSGAVMGLIDQYVHDGTKGLIAG